LDWYTFKHAEIEAKICSILVIVTGSTTKSVAGTTSVLLSMKRGQLLRKELVQVDILVVAMAMMVATILDSTKASCGCTIMVSIVGTVTVIICGSHGHVASIVGTVTLIICGSHGHGTRVSGVDDSAHDVLCRRRR